MKNDLSDTEACLLADKLNLWICFQAGHPVVSRTLAFVFRLGTKWSAQHLDLFSGWPPNGLPNTCICFLAGHPVVSQYIVFLFSIWCGISMDAWEL